MKANELMIGDWVECTYWTPSKQLKVAEIRRVMDDETKIGVYDDDLVLIFRQSEVKPIPLTPEILEKNGFIKEIDEDDRFTDTYHLLVPTGFERNSFTIQVSLYKEPIAGVSTLVKCWGWLPPYNGGLNDIHLCSANYVHELQHALRLCGIEKEIEL